MVVIYRKLIFLSESNLPSTSKSTTLFPNISLDIGKATSEDANLSTNSEIVSSIFASSSNSEIIPGFAALSSNDETTSEDVSIWILISKKLTFMLDKILEDNTIIKAMMIVMIIKMYTFL
ncbi:hypothetical protein GWI33_001646 [Rhynchophorus ferrugineus]|uniref:Uncharacterized protein n=1 Tax=Rhynchophorus ferrugineus TaxID=354439 RepID=A0A834IQ25_RHYFE|nr:hypothetical protein GWI33_001646 [Rhynchophorus ferrugineus]